MKRNSERFISSFNRINKWLIDTSGNTQGTSFVNLVNALRKRKDLRVGPFASDLIQFAQLRNAIVHDHTASGFVIAEPNDWAVERIEYIEQELIYPEKVLPRFRKNITGVPIDWLLTDFLRLVASKKYTVYPVFDADNHFAGLITLNRLGLILAEETTEGRRDFATQTVQTILERPEKRVGYDFIAGNISVHEVMEYFMKDPTLEVLLITKNGKMEEKILGLIRPKDLFQRKMKKGM